MPRSADTQSTDLCLVWAAVREASVESLEASSQALWGSSFQASLKASPSMTGEAASTGWAKRFSL